MQWSHAAPHEPRGILPAVPTTSIRSAPAESAEGDCGQTQNVASPPGFSSGGRAQPDENPTPFPHSAPRHEKFLNYVSLFARVLRIIADHCKPRKAYVTGSSSVCR